MIWFAVIFALFIGSAVGIYARSLSKGIRVGLVILVSGIILSILIFYSGILGG
jgi:hypothetical protein